MPAPRTREDLRWRAIWFRHFCGYSEEETVLDYPNGLQGATCLAILFQVMWTQRRREDVYDGNS